MAKSSAIPMHRLRERSPLGLEIFEFHTVTPAETSALGTHRDDHYIFLFQKQGSAKMIVDFAPIVVKGCVVFCILPGQVHEAIDPVNSSGWFIAIDQSLISPALRPAFEEYVLPRTPVALSPTEADRLTRCLTLLSDAYNKKEALTFSSHITRSLTDACIGMFAATYAQHEQSAHQPDSRTAIITRQFRSHLLRSFKTIKSPAAYADLLRISPSYLNESVKNITGLPVSHWIQQEIILEAKRLLYYTDNTVKEIAYTLGYNDHTYFSRLFKKTTDMSPLQFRQTYRK